MGFGIIRVSVISQKRYEPWLRSMANYLVTAQNLQPTPDFHRLGAFRPSEGIFPIMLHLTHT